MGEVAGMMAAGGAANFAGNKLGTAMAGGDNINKTLDSNANYVNSVINNMNNILSTALNNAINTNASGTNQAITAQEQYLNKAIQGSQAASNLGLAQSRALNAPYSLAGLTGMDAYMKSMGLATPAMGNAALQSRLFQATDPRVQDLMSQIQSSAQALGVQPGQQAINAPAGMAPSLFAGINSNYQTQQQQLANIPGAVPAVNAASAYNQGLFGPVRRV